ncbi:unnamed protein product [Diamesa hyperborea]
MKLVHILIVLNFIYFGSSSEVQENNLIRNKRHFLYPQFTTFQVMAPITKIPDNRRVGLNIGFQINYQMPFKLGSFYNPMFWARKLSHVSSPAISIDVNSTEYNEKYRVKRDLTAGQFYAGLKETMSLSGYHEDCLLKSVCELAKTPLHEDEDNIINEIMHFVLTPSLHQGFKDDETEEKEAFEEAEMNGRTGGDCELIYGNDCNISPLHIISNLNQLNLETS